MKEVRLFIPKTHIGSRLDVYIIYKDHIEYILFSNLKRQFFRSNYVIFRMFNE